MSKHCCMSPPGNLIADLTESQVLPPHLGLLGVALVQMAVPSTHKLHCCLKVIQHFLTKHASLVYQMSPVFKISSALLS